MAAKHDLEIVQGETFSRTLRWEVAPFVYKAVTGASAANGSLLITTGSAHGMPNGWRACVVSLGGMVEANAAHTPPWASDFQTGTVPSSTTVEFNEVDASGFTAWTSGGFLVYRTPQSLSGYTARMTIKDRIGGTALVTLTSSAGIALDDTLKTITVTIAATATDDITWTRAVYDLEMVSGAGVVTQLLYGAVTVRREVTT